MRGRRDVLASLGTALTLGLAGCGVNVPVDHRNATATARETPPERSTTPAADTGGLRVTTEETTADGLDWTVEKQSAATEDQPCELRIAVENTGQSRQLTAAGPTPFPPTRGTRTDGTDQMVHPAIIPVESGYERRFNGDCWQAPLDDPKIADDAPWDWGSGDTRTLTLEPSDRLEGSYEVVADWTRFCFQRGDYRFRRRYELAGSAHEWAFRLHVPAYDRHS